MALRVFDPPDRLGYFPSIMNSRFQVLSRHFATAFFLVAAVVFVPSPSAAVISNALHLSDSDRADIARMEAHLNSVKTLRSRFLQVSSTGEYAEGKLYLSRPGRLRMEYLPPKPLMVIADGANLIYVDTELEQMTAIPLGLTPAEILVRESISFESEEIIVTGFERSPGVLRLSLVKADEMLFEGNLTMVFSDRPLELRKWMVTDAQGEVTTVSLLGPESGIDLDPKLFDYVVPDGDAKN